MAKHPSTDPKAPAAPRPAEPATQAFNAAFAETLNFDDVQDFDDARRGFVGTLADGVIKTKRGSVVWDLKAYDFLDADAPPDTVNPSLWRMAKLNMINGLFKVTDRVYQIRGLDLANMTIIEGDSGLIIIDPLTTAEVAAAGLALYRQHRGDRPVRVVMYSHSHVDHYGGVKGVIDAADVAAGRVAVIAPDGFMEAVGGENVLAGNAMTRRAQFQFGGLLPKGPRGQVDAGLGKVTARGRVTLIAPSQLIVEPTERHVIDGIDMLFQLAPDSEAPAEMHMFMPALGVLNMAENATHNLHNFCPLRGAVVRDPRLWSHYLAEAIDMFGAGSEILIGQHHWPTWGQQRIVDYLAKQRDLYKFIHDQSVRLMNHGLRPAEIAEKLDLPPELAQEWSVRGYYGTVSHNSKAVYQRYLSWYDGNPANLHPLPPRDAARRTIDYMGGADAVVARARSDFAEGDYRWVAQVVSQLVYADPGHGDGRALLADAFEQLGYQAESATWRNAYLYGAHELRNGVADLPIRSILSPDLLDAVTTAMLFDFMAVRLDADKINGHAFVSNWLFTDSDEAIVLRLENSALSHGASGPSSEATVSLSLTRSDLVALTIDRNGLSAALDEGRIEAEGDVSAVEALMGMLDDFPFMFDVVTSAT